MEVAGSKGEGASPQYLVLLLSSFGLCADLYDIGVINLARPILTAEFGAPTPGQDSWMSASALMGAILGQIVCGCVADRIGRRFVFVCTVTIVSVASMGSACAGSWHNLSIYTILGMWRFVMGIGIGGEYPLAATTVAETASAESSGRSLALVFSGMAAGGLLGPILVMSMAAIGVPGAWLWRLAFGFGAVLTGVCACLRHIHLQETESWRKATRSAGSMRSGLLAMRWTLAGTSGTWLIYNVVTFGVGLFSTSIFPAASGLAAAGIVLRINTVALSGYMLAIYLSGHIRLKSMLMYAAAGMAVCFMILSVKLEHDRVRCLWIFALMRSLDVLGPGMVTFCLPAQVFPTRIRATAHGISAAAGKLGAVLGTIAFPFLNAQSVGLQTIMAAMATLCLLMCLWASAFLPSYDSAALREIEEYDHMPLRFQATLAERALFSMDAFAEAAPLKLSTAIWMK